jgi:hypothetical protein
MSDIHATVKIKHSINQTTFAWKGVAASRADAIDKAIHASNWLPKDDEEMLTFFLGSWDFQPDDEGGKG